MTTTYAILLSASGTTARLYVTNQGVPTTHRIIVREIGNCPISQEAQETINQALRNLARTPSDDAKVTKAKKAIADEAHVDAKKAEAIVASITRFFMPPTP